ncbi:MAG: hypothetical protein LUD76_09315 [Alistipes sp.]|nr:hypothetical protein [Alistipes sp.]
MPFDCLRRIAFINIKKQPGTSRSYDPEIRRHCEANKELLLSQIALADADVIIFGNTLRYFDKDDIAIPAGSQPYVSPIRNHFYAAGGKLFVNAWHPAYFAVDEKDYVMDIVRNVHKWQAGELPRNG